MQAYVFVSNELFLCYWQQFARVLLAAGASRGDRVGGEEWWGGIRSSYFLWNILFYFILCQKILRVCFFFRLERGWFSLCILKQGSGSSSPVELYLEDICPSVGCKHVSATGCRACLLSSPHSQLSKGRTFHLLPALHFQRLGKLVLPGSHGHRRFLLSRCTRIISPCDLCRTVRWCSQNTEWRRRSRGKKTWAISSCL